MDDAQRRILNILAALPRPVTVPAELPESAWKVFVYLRTEAPQTECSVRKMADLLDLGRGTVQRAITKLNELGWINSLPGNAAKRTVHRIIGGPDLAVPARRDGSGEKSI
jgi:DNA-binding MarR family transcriptional regulator